MNNPNNTYRERLLTAVVAFLLVFGIQVSGPAVTASSAASANTLSTDIAFSDASGATHQTLLAGVNHELTQADISAQEPDFPSSTDNILYFFGEEEITDSQEEKAGKQLQSRKNKSGLQLFVKKPAIALSVPLPLNDPTSCFLRTVLLLH